MALSHRRVSVGTTATRIDDIDTVLVLSVTMANRGTAPVFLGGPGVTAATGYEFAPGDQMALELKPSDGGLYAIAASGTVRIDRLQVGS